MCGKGEMFVFYVKQINNFVIISGQNSKTMQNALLRNAFLLR